MLDGGELPLAQQIPASYQAGSQPNEQSNADGLKLPNGGRYGGIGRGEENRGTHEGAKGCSSYCGDGGEALSPDRNGLQGVRRVHGSRGGCSR